MPAEISIRVLSAHAGQRPRGSGASVARQRTHTSEIVRMRADAIVKVTRTRANVFTLTATSQELSALIAAARLALDVMEQDPHAPRDALELLRRVVHDYDGALARLKKEDGRLGRPSADTPQDS